MPTKGFRRGDRLRSAIVELLGPDRSYGWLEELVYKQTRERISHRRLKRLAEEGNVQFSLAEFEALEEVAVHLGRGGLFLPQPSLLREIALARRVRVFVGTHALRQEQRSFCAFFDLLASMALVEALERAADTPLSWELAQVAPIFGGVNQEVGEPVGATFSIGSSLSNPASETLLAECLAVTPWRGDQGLPHLDRKKLGRFFSFIWNAEHVSTFALSPKELEAKATESIASALKTQSQIIPTGRAARGLLLDAPPTLRFWPEFEQVSDSGELVRWAYGILVAHRSYGAFPRVVAAGLNGPSTYLITRMLAQGLLGNKLALLKPGERRTFCAVVRGRVTEVHEPGDNRRVDDGEVLYQTEV